MPDIKLTKKEHRIVKFMQPLNDRIRVMKLTGAIYLEDSEVNTTTFDKLLNHGLIEKIDEGVLATEYELTEKGKNIKL